MHPRFRGVLLDWRGTLVVSPTYPNLVERGPRAAGRRPRRGHLRGGVRRARGPLRGGRRGRARDAGRCRGPGRCAQRHPRGRPTGLRRRAGGRRPHLADLVTSWTLSFEVGLAKPDPGVFRKACEALGVPPADVLMVGDRSAWDGAAVECGLTTFLVPPLTDPARSRPGSVLDLVLPGAGRP